MKGLKYFGHPEVKVIIISQISKTNLSYSLPKLLASILQNAQNDKIENVAGCDRLNLFMDDNAKCKLPSTSYSTGLSIIQHLIMVW
jgi:hypothetical protein